LNSVARANPVHAVLQKESGAPRSAPLDATQVREFYLPIFFFAAFLAAFFAMRILLETFSLVATAAHRVLPAHQAAAVSLLLRALAGDVKRKESGTRRASRLRL
jgi:hypothetical protein